MVVNLHPQNYLKQRGRLVREIYQGDSSYRDSGNQLLKLVMNPRGAFAAGAEVIPLTVASGGDAAVSAVFVVADLLPDTLQVGFFEALPECYGAVEALMDRARSLAAERGLERIVVGLDGHVNNGLGFLVSSCGKHASFGAAYNPPYYIDYLERCTERSETLLSYLYDLSVANMDKEMRIVERASRRFVFRCGDFSDLRREMGIYTRLNNACFREHPLYFERRADEDYQLFRLFGPFLKEENFLVAELDNEPVAFLLWYPDFYELIGPGRRLGVGALLKYRLLRKHISKFRIAEFGVLPEYQGTAVIAGLIHECIERGKRNGHCYCESGWVHAGNQESQRVVRRWTDTPHKVYRYSEIGKE